MKNRVTRQVEFIVVCFVYLALQFSCKTSPSKESKSIVLLNAKEARIELIDSLGEITLFVPKRYDTSFSWVYYSDCGKPCDEQKYRFQPKALHVTKESGFLWLGEPIDSIERFTISHTKYFPFHDGDTSKNIIRHNNIIAQFASNPENPPIVFDTIQKIYDRYFSIVAMEKSDSFQSRKVIAVSTIKSNEIKFSYDLLTKKDDSIAKNFIENSIELIKTIRIKKGL